MLKLLRPVSGRTFVRAVYLRFFWVHLSCTQSFWTSSYVNYPYRSDLFKNPAAEYIQLGTPQRTFRFFKCEISSFFERQYWTAWIRIRIL